MDEALKLRGGTLESWPRNPLPPTKLVFEISVANPSRDPDTLLAVEDFVAALVHICEGTRVVSVEAVRKLGREAIGMCLLKHGFLKVQEPEQLEMLF